MGVNALWQLLRTEQVVEWYRGNSPSDYAALLAAVDGQAVAIDLATWMMQADQQTALLPHFSREERCMKVAFERAVQWLRHGCLPVVVVEGQAPEEKQAAQRARFASRNGYAGGGSQAGASQFQRLGQTVGRLLEELGLPVFYAPGEAEAACAALQRAGCVDACASSDSDTLLYGAEVLQHTLKLSTTKPADCELKSVRMSSIRRRLGLQSGGAKALGVLAMLSGSDYDLDGAQGVGSVGGLAVARYLLQGDADDSQVVDRLAALIRRPPNTQLLELTQCTGCHACGHEGGRKSKIKRHSSRNVCACCPPSENGACREVAFERCGCAFHRLELERRVERILERVRSSPDFLQQAQAAIAVFERQGAEADAYVRQRLAQLGCTPGQRLRWLHRPRVQGVFDVIEERRRQMLWDLPAVRSKLLPVLLEWDLQQQAAGDDDVEAEFHAAAIQKVHGQKAKGEPLGEAHWRYVLNWERMLGDVEELGPLQVQPKKPRAGSKAAAAASGGEGDEDGDMPFSQAASQSQVLSQRVGGAASPGGEVETLTAREFDLRWLKEQPAEHRAVRVSAVHRLLPHLETQWQERQAGGGKASKGGKKAAAAAAAAGGAGPGSSSGGQKAAVGAAARKPRAAGGSKAARQLQLGGQEVAAGGAAATGEDRFADLTQYLAQRRAGHVPQAVAASSVAAEAAAATGKPKRAAALPGGGYGLAGGSGASDRQRPQQQQPQQQHQRQQHEGGGYGQYLPSSTAGMQALLSRALGKPGPPQQQQQQQQQLVRREEHPPPEQRTSPEKRLRSPRGGPGEAAGPAAGMPAGALPAGALPAGASTAADMDLGSPGFEVLLSSPDSPARGGQQQQKQEKQAWLGGPTGGSNRGRASSGGGGASRLASRTQQESEEGEDEEEEEPLPLGLRMAHRLGQEQAGRDGGREPQQLAQQQAQQLAQQQAQHLTQQQGQQTAGAQGVRARQQGPQRGKRASGGPSSVGRDIRTFLLPSPLPAPSPAVAAAAGTAGPQGASQADTSRQPAAAVAKGGAGFDVVDLVTPPRPRLARANREHAAVGQAGAQQHAQQAAAPQRHLAAALGGSPIDLTLSDSD